MQQMGQATVEAVYTFDTFPADLSDDNDIKQFDQTQGRSMGDSKVAVVIGSFPPGTETPMHSTPTANIGVILEGTLELHLDSGEVRTLRKGDSYTQRGTAHKWKNVGADWVRTATFTVPAVGIESVRSETSWYDTLQNTLEQAKVGD